MSSETGGEVEDIGSGLEFTAPFADVAAFAHVTALSNVAAFSDIAPFPHVATLPYIAALRPLPELAASFSCEDVCLLAPFGPVRSGWSLIIHGRSPLSRRSVS
jgi:hypothetical protein